MPFASVEEARTFLANYSSYTKYGFGRWAVEDKTTSGFLGWCGLKYLEDENLHDIGFRFLKNHWGKGFATEAARACIEMGFQKFNMPVIIGRAAKANKASINVLQKIGLHYLKEGDCPGDDASIFIIHNPWQK